MRGPHTTTLGGRGRGEPPSPTGHNVALSGTKEHSYRTIIASWHPTNVEDRRRMVTGNRAIRIPS
jgi:hypothetical protein